MSVTAQSPWRFDALTIREPFRLERIIARNEEVQFDGAGEVDGVE